MILSKLILRYGVLLNPKQYALKYTGRHKVTTSSGGIASPPHRTAYGIIGVICTVVPGLLIGAAISKSIASFLEENDLFVPSDDDDDDD